MPVDEHQKVTNWKYEYQQLMEEANLSRQLNNAGIDCMIAMDLEERILYWNPTCTDVFGAEYVHKSGQSFRSVFPSIAQQPAILNAFSQVKKGFKVFVPSEPDMWLPGHFELHLVPLKEEDGRLNGILFIAHDVAHRAFAELQLKELNLKLSAKYAELQRANETLATFTHITGQQFKEPLRKIYSVLERVVMEEGSRLLPKGRGAIRKVQSSAQRLGLLADSLTTFSEAKQAMVETVSLEVVLQQVVAGLTNQLRELNASITVNELPQVKGDQAQLRMLFQQLVSNALKFQKPGTMPIVSIVPRAVSQDELPPEIAERGATYTCVSVIDNGIGIRPEDRERIFQLFEKANHDYQYKGAGLGLALARKIAEHHEGFIRAGETPSGGSTMDVFLPSQ